VAEIDAARARATAVLRSGGWGVVDAGPQETIQDVWSRVTGGGGVAGNVQAAREMRTAATGTEGGTR
jgi:hypothetical protein